MNEPSGQTELRILLLENRPADAGRIEQALREAGTALIAKRVDTQEAFVRALDEFRPDIILAEYLLPSFDGGAALKIVRQHAPHIPVVMVTESLGDSKAIELLKLGAKDYVLKDQLAQLAPAVRHALSEEQNIRTRKAAEHVLRQNEAELRALIEFSPVAMVVNSGTGGGERTLAVNQKFTQLFGYTIEDIPDVHHWWPLAYPDEAYRESLKAEWGMLAEKSIRDNTAIPPKEVTITCKGGAVRYVKVSLATIGERNIITFEDLTERRQSEKQIRKLSKLYALVSQTNHAIVRTGKREELFCGICKAAVTHGDFILAWIGLVDETTRMVKPVCHYGNDQGYLTDIVISIDDVPAGRGATGTAIRNDCVSYVNDLTTDERARPWRDAALKRHIRAAAALPLRFQGKVIGALNLYAAETDFFDADQRELLEGMATDIAFALDNIAHEAERKAAEALLLERELQYRTLADSGQAMIWTAGTDKLCDYFNLPWIKFTGRPLEQLLGNGWADDVHPDDLARCMSIYTNAFDRREPFNVTYRLRRHDGQYRWLEDDGYPRHDVTGEFIGYIGYCFDVTERYQAEAELKRRIEFIDVLLENAPIGFAVNTISDGQFVLVSKRFAATYDVALEQLSNVKNFFESVYHDPEFREQIRTRVMADIASGDAARMHWENVPLTLRDGSQRLVNASNIPLPGQDLMISMVWDVTDRHQAEKSLRQSEEIFSRFMEFSPIYVFFKDDHARSLRLSRNYEKLLGKPLEELLGKNMAEIFPSEFAKAMVADDLRVLQEGKEITAEEEFNGRFYSTTKFPIFIEGKPRFIAGYTIDITERKQRAEQLAAEYRHIAEINTKLSEANRQLKQAQSQLLQSEKMASIGVLAAGVAHEINNPIGYVNSNIGTLGKYLTDIFTLLDKCEAAEKRLDKDDPQLEELRQFRQQIDLGYIREDTRALLSETHQGLERVKKIVLDLKNFSHADTEDQWVWHDIGQILDTTLNVVWNELKYKCEVIKDYAALSPIYCLPSQLDQVFMNLLVNAAQAIETHGTITLRTGREDDRIWVDVIDTGKGIPPENIPRLFDPFFTTKPVGKGTGLGLSVSYNIVEKHHGKIEVRSEVGKGATFRVWLPVRQPDTKEKA